MKKLLFLLSAIVLSTVLSGQWKQSVTLSQDGILQESRVFSLDVKYLSDQVKNAHETGQYSRPVVIKVPISDGKIERFEVFSSPVVSATLAKKYKLGSYVGRGIDDPSKYLRFSFTNGKFQSMILHGTEMEFIEPIDAKGNLYKIIRKANVASPLGFICSTEESPLEKKQLQKLISKPKPMALRNVYANMAQVSDRKFRKLRLAVSVTGEYTQYFGGTVQSALAAINASLTRVNGVFEKELALQLILQDFPQLIFTDPTTDPYSDAAEGVNGAWSFEIQNTLTSTIGNGAYDIGHLFGASGSGGNAGCIGCVCRDDSAETNDLNKGAAFTSPADGKPEGYSFDIDFVTHEMGHQLGAHHTFSYVLEDAGRNVEPGSGSTIMGYAGITGSTTDVQTNSDDYFHIRSIQEILDVLKTTSCDEELPINNTAPSITPLQDYTIPKSTAFVLDAHASDAEGDALTYSWEQVDNAEVSVNNSNLGKNATGALFRSMPPSEISKRYLPRLTTVLDGQLKSAKDWEAAPEISRKLQFAVTVRDQHLQYPQMSMAEQTISVGDDGPFEFRMAPNIYTKVPTTVSWEVANTADAPYNVSNVKIDYTTDNGLNWILLTNSTPNDGKENFQFPEGLFGKSVKLRISAIGNVFYAVSPEMKVTGQPQLCDASAPQNLRINNVTANSALVLWSEVQGNQYSIRFKKALSTIWTLLTSDENIISLSGLDDDNSYEVQVAAICSGRVGQYSASQTFKTSSKLAYCNLASANSRYEFISNVTLAGMGNDSRSSSYSDFTETPATYIYLKKGERYSLSVSKSWSLDKYDEAVTAWIDYNRDGTFSDSEKIMATALDQKSPVGVSFTVPKEAYTGDKPVRLRVVLTDQAKVDSACGQYDFGEVEDYNVFIEDPAKTLERQQIILYPNPVHQRLFIGNAEDGMIYEIYNMAGQLVKKGTLENEVVDVASLSTGIFVINLTWSNGKFSSKFIKK